jgi:hypothetical protein
MPDITFGQFFSKKAFEISYALFRIATVSHNRRLAEHLEGRALDLLDATASGDYKKSKSMLDAVEYIVRLGIEIGTISDKTGALIIGEVQYLNSAIAEFDKPAKLPDVDIESIFSKDFQSEPRGEDKNIKTETTVGKSDRVDTEIEIERNVVEPESQQSGFKMVMRQSAIVDRIRQFGTCRLKDIQEILPDISERTIRYDLQKLAEQGSIERIGSGGPATYYQVKSA